MGSWVEPEYLRESPGRDEFNSEYYCYILWIEEELLYYIGHTGNLPERMAEHQRGDAEATADYNVKVKVWESEALPTRAAVTQLEATLKGRILRGEIDRFEERTGLTFVRGATLLDPVSDRH